MTKDRNNSLDALLLAFTKLLSVFITLVSTSVLSHVLDLQMYGTYATGNLIVNTGSLLTAFGLMDATNYYFHQESRSEESVNTVFFLEAVVGILCALALLFGKGLVIRYFKNPQLDMIYALILIRPMLTNMSGSLFALQAAVGKAKALAVKGLSFSLIKLIAILITSFVYQDIRIIFWAFLLFDIVSIWFFYQIFKGEAYAIRPHKFAKDLIIPILKFSLPIGVYIFAGELMKNIDKYVIAFFENTEQLAIYTNSSLQLPFSVISDSFLTIMVPLITSMVVKRKYKNGINMMKAYLRIGYITNVTFTVACIIFSRELILLLYGDKYLSGSTVFITYLLVDMLKFAGFTLVLVAFGKTRFLMKVSVTTLILNLILNPIFYLVFGMNGPAFATLLITVGTVSVFLYTSVRSLHGKMSMIFPPKKMLIFAAELFAAGAVLVLLKQTAFVAGLPFFVRLVVGAGLFCGCIFLLQLKELLRAMKAINKYRN